jgi:hypothetical protein
MEDGTIPNSAITASSVYGPGKESWRGRLNNFPADPKNVLKDVGVWIALQNKISGEYLQIDLGRVTTVTMVATQGRPVGFPQWVTSYAIDYSTDGSLWLHYRENGEDKVNKHLLSLTLKYSHDSIEQSGEKYGNFIFLFFLFNNIIPLH